MKMHKSVLVILVFLVGCVGMASHNVQKEFTYDFLLPGKSKNVLWQNARDYFAGAYGDSRVVFRVADEKDGTLIGRGLAPWMLIANNCTVEYHIRFAAKDGKARLQYELIEGVLGQGPCPGWPWPSEEGYKEITQSFSETAKNLEHELKGDNFKDF
jgi:Domain of unknown function (DUF4468) with TBP-like fold